MRKLFAIVFLAAFGWAAYWFIGSTAVERGLKAWFDGRENAGWVANYDALNTRGFPSRFDTTIEGLELADPRSGVAWTVPQLDILALSYRPNHIIAILPGTQVLATPYQKIEIGAQTLRGSVVFEPDTDLALDRSSFEIANMVVGSSLGWQAEIAQGKFATRRPDEDDPLTHDIAFEATNLTPSDSLRKRLDPAGLLPDSFALFTTQITASFDSPWDRHAIERARPQPTALKIDKLQAQWGNLDLRVAGDLTISDTGRPTGEITVKATNWRDMIALGQASGALQPSAADILTKVLELVSAASGDPNTLDAPLTFRNGRISFGIIPLGRAPRLVIR